MGRSTGLIGYSTLRIDAEGLGTRKVSVKQSFLRTRPLANLTVFVALILGLIFVLRGREAVDLMIIRAVGSPYEEIHREGLPTEVVNRFHIDLQNLSFSRRRITLSLTEGAKSIQIVANDFPLEIKSGEQRRATIFLKFPKTALEHGKKLIQLVAKSHGSSEGTALLQTREVNLVGPY